MFSFAERPEWAERYLCPWTRHESWAGVKWVEFTRPAFNGMSRMVVIFATYLVGEDRWQVYSPGTFPGVPEASDIDWVVGPGHAEQLLRLLRSQHDYDELREVARAAVASFSSCEEREAAHRARAGTPRWQTTTDDAHEHEPTFHHSPTFEQWPSHRFAAVEVEIVDGDPAIITATAAKWGMGVVHELSVPDGIEVNTSPANGDTLFTQIAELHRAFADGKATVDERCGIHVHVDIRSYTYKQMARAILLYSFIEEAVFNLVPRRRRNAKWCRRRQGQIVKAGFTPTLVETESPLDLKARLLWLIHECDGGLRDAAEPPDRSQGIFRFNELAYRNAMRKFRRDAQKRAEGKLLLDEDLVTARPQRRNRSGILDSEGSRYYAFNPIAWFDHGTVEIRLHEETVDLTGRVLPWLCFWIAFFDEVRSINTTKFDFEQDPMKWMHQVLASRSAPMADMFVSRV